MVIIQSCPKRKLTGGRYSSAQFRKRKCDLGRAPSLIKLDKFTIKKIRVLGGNIKNRVKTADLVNVADPKTKATKKVKILSILENPANRHYVRRNIITKGTVVATDIGKVRVTSRPGQDGTLNGVLL